VLLDASPVYRDYLGLFAIAMAAFYLLLGSLAFSRNPGDRLLSLSWLGLGLSFAILTVPLQLKGHWILIGWAAESAILVWIGIRLPSRALRGVGLVLQVVVAGWMLLLYTLDSGPGAGFIPLLNETFLTFLGGLAALVVTLLLYSYSERECGEAPGLRPLLAVALGVLLLWGLTAELLASFSWWENHRLVGPQTVNFAVSALWCGYATALVSLGMWRRSVPLRLLGLLVFGVAILKVFLFDLSELERVWRILSFVCLGLLLLGVSYLYHLYADRVRAFVSDGAPGSGEGEA